MTIIAPIPRDERGLMQKAIHKTCDENHTRRLTAMLMLHRGERVSDVARTLYCARSSIGRLRCQVLKALSHYRQGEGDAGRLNIFARCCLSLLSILLAIWVISLPAGVPNCWQ